MTQKYHCSVFFTNRYYNVVYSHMNTGYDFHMCQCKIKSKITGCQNELSK